MIISEGNGGRTGLLFGYLFFIFFIFNSLAFKIIKKLAITTSDTFIIITNTVFLYTALLVLYSGNAKPPVESITLCFGITYFVTAIFVRKYTDSQGHFYNGLFGISLAALIAYAGMKFTSFGLTIIWVLMAVVMFVIGMVFKLKIFRIAAILLFAITLVKLLVFDSLKFNSIQKVVAYLFIGIVLLIISFLYQKYKQIIFETGDD